MKPRLLATIAVVLTTLLALAATAVSRKVRGSMFLAVVLVPIVSIACGGGDTAIQSDKAEPRNVESTSTPQLGSTVAPSPGITPTSTRLATSTPTAQTTPMPVRCEAAAIITELRRQGLPVGDFKSYTAADDPNQLLGRPGQYTSKVNFHDKRLIPDPEFDTESGGSVECFSSSNDAARRAQYIKTVTQGVPFLVEYDYVHELMLLRLSKALTPDQAGEYEAAITTMFGP